MYYRYIYVLPYLF